MADRNVAGELELYARQNARVARNVDHVLSGAARHHVRAVLETRLGRVRSLDAGAYRPPAFLAKVVGRAEADALHALLRRMKEHNDEYAGEPVAEVAVLLNGDPGILETRASLRAWADRYVARRIARGHPKDMGDPVRTWARLYEELTPWLESVAFRPEGDTLHPLYLDEVTDYIPWLLYRATWAPLMRIEPGEGGYHLDWGPIAVGVRPILYEQLKLYSWDLDTTLPALAESLGKPGDGGGPGGIELAELAADLWEMRPLLTRNFRPERTIVRLADDVFVAFIWNLKHHVGTILAAPTERELLERLARGVSPWVAHLSADGTVRHVSLPWLRLDELPGGDVATRRIVEAVHARLFAFYDQIDVDAIARGSRPAEPDPEGTVDEVEGAEVVAASVDVLRRSEGESASGRLGVRTSRLLSVLERLGCEVRQGKGSEISIYRPGGKIWSLTHHKRNERHGWSVIRRILKRLGVSVEDWADAVHG